eukprot:jgi/Mesvir1/23302/Mv20998-RA.1
MKGKKSIPTVSSSWALGAVAASFQGNKWQVKSNRLNHWFAHHGALLTPGIAFNVDKARTSFALCNAGKEPVSGVLLTIPFSSVVTKKSILADSALGSIYDDLLRSGVVDEMLLLVLYFFVEHVRGRASPLASYLAALPQFLNSPIFFTERERKELQGTPLMEAVRTRTKRVEDLYRGRMRAAALRCVRELPGELEEAVTYKLFTWAYTLVWSYSLRLPDLDQSPDLRQLAADAVQREQQGNLAQEYYPSVMGLVPGLCFCPHDHNSRITWVMDGDHASISGKPNSVSLVTSDGYAVQPGEEIRVNFGYRSNEDLLMRFCAAVENNPHDELHLHYPIEHLRFDPFVEERLGLLQAQKLSLEWDISACILPQHSGTYHPQQRRSIKSPPRRGAVWPQRPPHGTGSPGTPVGGGGSPRPPWHGSSVDGSEEWSGSTTRTSFANSMRSARLSRSITDSLVRLGGPRGSRSSLARSITTAVTGGGASMANSVVTASSSLDDMSSAFLGYSFVGGEEDSEGGDRAQRPADSGGEDRINEYLYNNDKWHREAERVARPFSRTSSHVSSSSASLASLAWFAIPATVYQTLRLCCLTHQELRELLNALAEQMQYNVDFANWSAKREAAVEWSEAAVAPPPVPPPADMMEHLAYLMSGVRKGNPEFDLRALELLESLLQEKVRELEAVSGPPEQDEALLQRSVVVAEPLPGDVEPARPPQPPQPGCLTPAARACIVYRLGLKKIAREALRQTQMARAAIETPVGPETPST